jgi:hypothetical protein
MGAPDFRQEPVIGPIREKELVVTITFFLARPMRILLSTLLIQKNNHREHKGHRDKSQFPSTKFQINTNSQNTKPQIPPLPAFGIWDLKFGIFF